MGAVADILAGLGLAQRRLDRAQFVLAVHAIHPVRYPTRSGLQVHHMKFREQFGDAPEDHAGELEHLRERVADSMDSDKLVKGISLDVRAANPAAGVNSHWNT